MRCVLILGALLLPSIAAADTGHAPLSTPVRVVAFTCMTGERLQVAFAGRTATLSEAGGRRVALGQHPSGSGFLYKGYGYALRGKGDSITVTAPGSQPRDCSASTPTSAMSQPLAGTRWELVQFRSSDDTIGTIRPPVPARYTLELRADGRMAARLDCNRAMGGWTATPNSTTGGSLTFAPAGMTRAMCAPGSMDARIARDLGRIRSYTLVGDMLTLALEADGGLYSWRRLP